MPKLVSLKQTEKQWTEPAGVDRDEYYPSIYFDENTLDAMEIGNLRVGTEMTMIATVPVSTASESKNGSRSMSFELIEGAMTPKEPDKDASAILFPNG